MGIVMKKLLIITSLLCLCAVVVYQDMFGGHAVSKGSAMPDLVRDLPPTHLRRDLVQKLALAKDNNGELIFPSGFDNLPHEVKDRILDSKIGQFLKDFSAYRRLRTLQGHDEIIISVAWSPDGTLLASDSEANAKIWDSQTGALITTLQGHDEIIFSVAWSPDGTQLACGTNNGAINIWSSLKVPLQNYFYKEINKDPKFRIEKKMLFVILMALKEPNRRLLLEDVVRQGAGLTLQELKAIRDSFPQNIRNLIGKLLVRPDVAL